MGVVNVQQQSQVGPSVWIALATHPHRESIAIQNLDRQSVRTYCPMIIKRIRHARRSFDALRPLFPGYLFVEHCNPLGPWRHLVGTLGVRSTVMSGDRPARLPAGFVESLMAREVDGAVCAPEELFQIGQQVTINGGAFDGLVGQIIELRENERVILLLNLLQQQTRLNIHAKALAAV